MLMGSGPFVRAEMQAQFNTEVLQLSQQLAFQALQSVHLSGQGTPSFGNVKQGDTEPFGKFIDRLHDAIMRHPDLTPELKVKLLDTLAYENANEKTKRVIGILPKGATTAQMLEATELCQNPTKRLTLLPLLEQRCEPITIIMIMIGSGKTKRVI